MAGLLWISGSPVLKGEPPSRPLNSAEFRFSHLTINQGLSQNNVFCILQDRRGFMWFGTEDGLNRFDGFEFTYFMRDPADPWSLSNDTITALYEDRDGLIWVGTSGGLNVLDPDTGRVRRIGKAAGEPEWLGSVQIKAICQDRQGRIWVGTADGLLRTDPAGRIWTCFRHVPAEPSSLRNNEVTALLIDREDTLWVGGSTGLSRLEAQSGDFTVVSGGRGGPAVAGPEWITCLQEDSAGAIWAGTNGGGLWQWQAAARRLASYQSVQIAEDAQSIQYIKSMATDSAGRLWVGTHGSGVVIINPAGGEYVHLTFQSNNPSSIGYNLVASMFRDRSHTMWVGTHGNGLDLWNPYQQKFECHQHDPVDPASLGITSVRGILEDREGALWVAGYSGLDRMDRATGQFEHIPQFWSNGVVRVLREDPVESGRIVWMGIESGRFQLVAFDRVRRAPREMIRLPDRFGFNSDLITDLLLEPDGQTWVGTGDGLLWFHRGTGEHVDYRPSSGESDGPGSGRVNVIHRDAAGNLWVGTMNGLCRLDPAAGKWAHFRHRDDDPRSLASDSVSDLADGGDGFLWVGTHAGLCRLEVGTGACTHFTMRNGLPNDVIYGILPDGRGNLWLSTNNGLARLDPRSGACRNYDASDGLQSNEFNAGAHYRSRSGELFFGGISGFNAFRPETIRDNPQAPPVMITELQILNQPVPVGPTKDGRKILSRLIHATSVVELEHDDRVVTIGFAALNFMFSAKNLHAFMLEGWEDDWNRVGSRRYATYANLPPGDYVFRVKGSNNDGVWNEQGAAIAIRVNPPFWATWWFRSGALVLLITSLWGGYRARTMSIRRRNRQLQAVNIALREQIAERRRAEDALRLSETKHRTLTENLTVGIFRISTGPSNRFVEANPALAAILGLPAREDLIGRSPAEFFEEAGDWEEFLRMLEQQGSAHLNLAEMRRFDAARISCALRAVAFRDAGGNVLGYDGLIEDVTERRVLEQQIRQTQKMEAVGQLAGGIAHDFNNILTVINGRAEMALSQLKLEEPAYRSVCEILQSGRRAGDLIRQLLAFSRRQMIAPTVVDVNQVIVGMERMLRRLIGEDIRMQSVLAAGLPPIKADPGQLEQVFLNLVVNARDAIAELGDRGADKQITITTSVAAIQDEYIQGQPEIKPGSYVIMAVSDTGAGMSADIQSRIFEPFFTTKEAGRGTGLGLATVFGIVKQNGGAISVYSEPGRGSTFRIYWPATPVDGDKLTEATPAAGIVGGEETILVVEDDPQVRQFACDGLRGAGFRVMEAESGAAALQILEAPGVQVDLILTDVVMPGMSGTELAARLTGRFSRVPVLFASGYADHHLAEDGQLKTGINFIEKPFAIRTLARKIRDLIDRPKG